MNEMSSKKWVEEMCKAIDKIKHTLPKPVMIDLDDRTPEQRRSDVNSLRETARLLDEYMVIRENNTDDTKRVLEIARLVYLRAFKHSGPDKRAIEYMEDFYQIQITRRKLEVPRK